MTESAARTIVIEAKANLRLSLRHQHSKKETLKQRQYITRIARRHAPQPEHPFDEDSPVTQHILIETMMDLLVSKNEPGLDMLKTKYGVADTIIASLSKSESEAQAAISFFGKMTAIANGLIITLGIVTSVSGFRQWQATENSVWLLVVFSGLILALYFLFIFWCQRTVLHMMQSYVNIKYNTKNPHSK